MLLLMRLWSRQTFGQSCIALIKVKNVLDVFACHGPPSTYGIAVTANHIQPQEPPNEAF